MSIWKKKFEIEQLVRFEKNTIVEHLGIAITEIGEDFIEATMPVDHRTHQPYGILHGGASVVLAETIASIGAQMVAGENYQCVGLDINANHIRSVRSGLVTGRATALHLGRTTQVWEIKIVNEQQKLVCISRLTVSVLERKS